MSDQINSTVQDEQAQRLERVARQAERMAEHARIAAAHFRDREVPRAAAHTLAVVGHMGLIRQLLDEIAGAHAAKAQTSV